MALILAKANLKPLFWLDTTYIYFAEDTQDKSIHLALVRIFIKEAGMTDKQKIQKDKGWASLHTRLLRQ